MKNKEEPSIGSGGDWRFPPSAPSPAPQYKFGGPEGLVRWADRPGHVLLHPFAPLAFGNTNG